MRSRGPGASAVTFNNEKAISPISWKRRWWRQNGCYSHGGYGGVSYEVAALATEVAIIVKAVGISLDDNS
ncbi:hypothetical protein GBA52_026780, partial [Prunus armeniaca]